MSSSPRALARFALVLVLWAFVHAAREAGLERDARLLTTGALVLVAWTLGALGRELGAPRIVGAMVAGALAVVVGELDASRVAELAMAGDVAAVLVGLVRGMDPRIRITRLARASSEIDARGAAGWALALDVIGLVLVLVAIGGPRFGVPLVLFVCGHAIGRGMRGATWRPTWLGDLAAPALALLGGLAGASIALARHAPIVAAIVGVSVLRVLVVLAAGRLSTAPAARSTRRGDPFHP